MSYALQYSVAQSSAVGHSTTETVAPLWTDYKGGAPFHVIVIFVMMMMIIIIIIIIIYLVLLLCCNRHVAVYDAVLMRWCNDIPLGGGCGVGIVDFVRRAIRVKMERFSCHVGR